MRQTLQGSIFTDEVMMMKFLKLTILMSLLMYPAISSAEEIASKKYSTPSNVNSKVISNWQGSYGGLLVGSVSNEVDYIDTYWSIPIEQKQNSFSFGGSLGHNWRFGDTVFGIETDISIFEFDKQTMFYHVDDPDGEYDNAITTKMNWLNTNRLRIGYIFNEILFYATTGAAIATLKHKSEWTPLQNICGQTTDFTSCVDELSIGLAYGGGVEFNLSPQWTLKAEYVRISFPSITTRETGCDQEFGCAYTWKNSIGKANIGINYHF